MGGGLLLIIDLFLNVAYAVVNNESCHAVFLPIQVLCIGNQRVHFAIVCNVFDLES